MNRRAWAAAGTALIAFAVFYGLITPALWANPAAFISYLVQNAMAFQRWQMQLLLRGTVFATKKQPLPWYYLPYMMIATTPLWLLALTTLGTVLAVWKLRRSNADEALSLLMVLGMWILPLGFALLTRTRVYNGWRHFYFVYGPMMALAAWGVSRLLHKRVLAALLACCMAFGAAGIVMEHPYQYAYYQPLVRLKGTDYNELDYWNISIRDALTRLAAETDGIITVEPGDSWTENGLHKVLQVLPEEIAGRFQVKEDAQYVLSNATYARITGFSDEGLQERIRLDSYGQPIMRIYERTKEAETP